MAKVKDTRTDSPDSLEITTKDLALLRIEDPDWPEDPRAWLESRGWKWLPLEERSGKKFCWRDYKGGTGSHMEVVAQKKIREGVFQDVKQVVVDALPWTYTTEQAIELQRERDK